VHGSLAGLYAAFLLEQQRIPCVLFETQSRLGKIVSGAQSKTDTGYYFDLCAT
jgi:monoamine oxidase